MTVLGAFGYKADMRPLVAATGAASVVVAPFGGHAINLAAITAAISAAPEAHQDPGRRWVASASAGALFALFGAGAGVAAVLATAAPPLLLETVAGLALLRTLAGSLAAVGAATSGRDAAVVAFVVTASQVAPGGVGSPFWGLLAGSAVAIVTSSDVRGRLSSSGRAARRGARPAVGDAVVR
jgi:benzoate membrane transport protein